MGLDGLLPLGETMKTHKTVTPQGISKMFLAWVGCESACCKSCGRASTLHEWDSKTGCSSQGDLECWVARGCSKQPFTVRGKKRKGEKKRKRRI